MDLFLKKKNLTVKEFLEIAIKITSSLTKIHALSIIHKNINPSNIIFNPRTKVLKFIDFGICTILPKEKTNLKNPNILEGNLAYISPEQTGRINRFLDYRSDFYSLGVTFYELVTNQLPFNVSDSLELIHCHIAKDPIAPYKVNQNIPEVISNIIMKLMAKNAEDRYQTCWGIKNDLETCLTQLENQGKIIIFKLASQDICDRFALSQKIYGRKKEVRQLLDCFDLIKLASKKMMFISGPSGIGKSALVKEIYQSVTKAKGYLVEGKFEQYQRNIPYSGIVQAFGNLIEYLLAENQEDLEEWRKKILAALGINASIIIEVIPKLTAIIGKVQQAPVLSAKESENRFNIVFQNFIKVFTCSQYPLVIFLEDLHWADSASLRLIKLIIIESKSKNLLIIGTYRDDELNSIASLISIKNEIKKAQIITDEISLSALKLCDIENLIKDSLSCSCEAANSLAKLVLDKTNGNPFFINKFLRSLYQENLLFFDKSGYYWEWDTEAIKKHNVTENVANLLSISIEKLDLETQKILKIAACIGNKFDITYLTMISQKDVKEIVILLEKVIELGLVLPLNNYHYRLIYSNTDILTDTFKLNYQFVHDRIQHTIYSSITDKDKQETHYKIGQILLQNTSFDRREEKIFDIVNRLNLGKDLIDCQEEKDELAKLNFQAGIKAKSSVALIIELKYFDIGLKLLHDNSWQRNYQLSLNLHIETAELSYLTGNFEKLKQIKKEVLLNVPKDNILDRIKIYKVEIEVQKNQGKISQAIKTGLLVLNQLEEKLIENPRKIRLLLEFIRIYYILIKKSKQELINLPQMSNPKKLEVISILKLISAVTYFHSPQLHSLIVFRQIFLSIKYGNTFATPSNYALYGIIILKVFRNFNLAYHFGELSLELEKKLNSQESKPIVALAVNGFLVHIKKHLNQTLSSLKQGFHDGLEIGNLEYAIYNNVSYIEYSFLSGKPLNGIKKIILDRQDVINKFQKQIINYRTDILLQLIQLLKDEKLTLNDCEIDINDSLSISFLKNHENILFFYYFCKLIIDYLNYNFISAQENAILARKYLITQLAMPVEPIFYFYDSLIKIELFSIKKIKIKTTIKEIGKNQNKLKDWVYYAPMNYQHKYNLVAAELYRVKGNKEKAANLYAQAIEGAHKYEYLNEEALARELAAKFYFEWNKLDIARLYIKEACYKYKLWGAIAKVKQLHKKYQQLLSSDLVKKSEEKDLAVISGKDSDNVKLEIIDLVTVLEANKALSGELDFKKLLKKLIKIIIENAGASLGYLILNREGNFVIEAKATSLEREATVLKSIPIESKDNNTQLPLLPEQIINYVARTQEKLVLDDATSRLQFVNDSYIKTIQPKSILCIPLLNKGQLIGLVYLENKFTTAAFTSERVELLKAIGSQAAISIQNARLFKERIQAEKALSEKEKQLSDFLEAIPVGVFIINSEEKTYYLNQTAKKILGKRVETVPFEDLTKFYNAYDSTQNILYPKDKSPIRRALEGAESYISDMEIRRRDLKDPIPRCMEYSHQK
ncbi:MAG: AAA family ATPase [Prochloraceae cyanobacterium]